MWILLVMVGLLLLGVPMMVPLSVGTFFLLFSDFSFLKPELVIQQMIGGLQPVVLTAVPMFILAADIMLKGSTAQRLLDLVERFVPRNARINRLCVARSRRDSLKGRSLDVRVRIQKLGSDSVDNSPRGL